MAELIVAIISALIALAGFISAWHARSKANRAQELQEIKEQTTSQTNQKIDDLRSYLQEIKDEDIGELKQDVKAMREDITNLHVRTGVHDAIINRDRERFLRAVNE